MSSSRSAAVRVLRLRVKDKHASWLCGLAREVNTVFNYCNELLVKVFERERRFLSGFDFWPFLKGATRGDCALLLPVQAVQEIAEEYARRRRQHRKIRLAWRKSGGARRSLCVPRAPRGGDDRNKPPVAAILDRSVPSLGIDLGLKTFAAFSDEALPPIEAERFYRDLEPLLARAQRARHRHRSRAIHAKIANRRKDFLHKLSTELVKANGALFVGNVNASALAKTRLAKSVLDAGWSVFRTMLQYKCNDAGVWFDVGFIRPKCLYGGGVPGRSNSMKALVRCLVCGMSLTLMLAVGFSGSAAAAPKRPLLVTDFDRMLDVEEPVCSRDGRWILYMVEGADVEADERKGAVWLVNWEGTENFRLTAPAEGVSNAQFSPDGRFVSFIAERGAGAKAQLYLLDRRGGEAEALTSGTGDIGGYGWSPDGSRIVLSTAPGEGESSAKAPKPIVIDRLHFKADKKGYVTAADRARLFLLDVKTKKLEPLTDDVRFDDTSPVWSPDGKSIAFFSSRESDPDRSGRQELYVVDARRGAVPRKLTAFFSGNKGPLLWDGARIVYAFGSEPKLNAYIQDHLAVVSVADGKSRVIAEGLDRALSFPALTGQNGSIAAIIEDDGSEVPVVLRIDTGAIQQRLAGKYSTTGLCSGGGHTAVVTATDATAPELYALEGGKLRKLTGHNDALMTELQLGSVEDIIFPSRDGTLIHGLMTKPFGFRAGQKYPTLLWIHGGPNGQDAHGLDFSGYPLAVERQWFAAQGYVVLGINYRGSSGRGLDFADAIAGDWGNKEVADLLAGIDYVVRENIADPRRLGVGGWSYGGILTDYTIASDQRFKAAISGAGSANQLSMYGHDQYILQYNAELGPPWEQTDRWLEVSYPFLHADRITTPTLFMGGEIDFNVPIAGGEQMYQALRTREVPTQLVIYPGQYHIFTRPSYVRDRIERFTAWFDRYLAITAQ